MKDSGAQIVADYHEALLRDYFRLGPQQEAVCHYTTGAALASIIESGVLWLTNVRFMNDPAELRHPVEMLRDFVRRAKFGVVMRDTPAIDHLGNHVIPKLEERSTRQFILSTSLDIDSSYMWDYYGKEGGYALEFHIPTLVGLLEQSKVRLRSNSSFLYEDFSRFNGRLLYDEIMQMRLVDYTIDFIDSIIANPPISSGIFNSMQVAEIVTGVTHVFCAALYNMKDSHHAKENEYRFVTIPDDGYDRVKVMHTSQTEVPYVEAYGTLSAATRIWIGPGKHDSSMLARIGTIVSNKYPNIALETNAVVRSDGTSH